VFGNSTSFNLNSMLHRNISSSSYFISLCTSVTDWKALVDEVYYKVTHVEPFGSHGVNAPSTAFCLLYRMMTLRCTEKQMHAMLNHLDSPYIRCIGFLYLRYATDPTELMNWYRPYLYDTEEFVASGKHGATSITMGEYVRSLITSLDYYSTMLPRIPVPTARQFKVQLLQASMNQERGRRNESKVYLCVPGARIRALYEDIENPLAWYDAVIDSIEVKAQEWDVQKYTVTFIEYGNTEIVALTEIEVGDNTGQYERLATMDQVMANERDASSSHGKQHVGAIKGMSQSMATSASGGKRARDVDKSQSKVEYVYAPPAGGGDANKNSSSSASAQQHVPPPAAKKQKTAAELAAIEEKKRKLAASYG
jgi:pre-mRNA-splicing factor 38B